jgi:hypothetical protein
LQELTGQIWKVVNRVKLWLTRKRMSDKYFKESKEAKGVELGAVKGGSF